MEPNEFEEKMKNLKKPQTESVKAPPEIKLAIVNAQRSAVLGFWFVVIPYLFIFAMIMKFELRINLGILDAFANAVGVIDSTPWLWWIQPVALLGLPMVGIILNALAITHFKWDATTRSVIITLKIRWINIIVMALSVLILKAFVLYLIAENFQAWPGP